MRDAVAHLQRRFPDVVAVPEAAAMPPAGWGLVNDGLEPLLGYAPSTTFERGIDALLRAAAAGKAWLAEGGLGSLCPDPRRASG